MIRLVDAAGVTVEPCSIDGVPQFIVRGPSGHLLHGARANGTPDPRTPADLVALGVDLASLQARP